MFNSPFDQCVCTFIVASLYSSLALFSVFLVVSCKSLPEFNPVAWFLIFYYFTSSRQAK